MVIDKLLMAKMIIFMNKNHHLFQNLKHHFSCDDDEFNPFAIIVNDIIIN